jgi:hypothetical protein
MFIDNIFDLAFGIRSKIWDINGMFDFLIFREDPKYVMR